MKILVTGDRYWTDIDCVYLTLKEFPAETIIIHGACKGADTACDLVARALGFTVRDYPAQWTGCDRSAGPIRNQKMLDCEHVNHEPIDLCLAFHDNIDDSRGTKDMVKRAQKAKILTRLIRSCQSHP